MTAEMDAVMRRLKPYKLDDWRPVGLSDIEEYEAKLGVEFPDDYKEFLLKYSGQAPDRGPRFPYLDEYPGGDEGILSVFFGIMPDSGYDLLEATDTYEGRVPEDLLPIAEDPGGNVILLGVGGEDRGKVYFFDHEEERPVPEGEEIDRSNLYLIANSFGDFIESLKPAPEE